MLKIIADKDGIPVLPQELEELVALTPSLKSFLANQASVADHKAQITKAEDRIKELESVESKRAIVGDFLTNLSRAEWLQIGKELGYEPEVEQLSDVQAKDLEGEPKANARSEAPAAVSDAAPQNKSVFLPKFGVLVKIK